MTKTGTVSVLVADTCPNCKMDLKVHTNENLIDCALILLED